MKLFQDQVFKEHFGQKMGDVSVLSVSLIPLLFGLVILYKGWVQPF